MLIEDAEALLDEAQKEYERRRGRQPLETILPNADRYENDYQVAENRSRDRLREAKQAYSLAYDFGYDDDEDAARYVCASATNSSSRSCPATSSRSPGSAPWPSRSWSKTLSTACASRSKRPASSSAT